MLPGYGFALREARQEGAAAPGLCAYKLPRDFDIRDHDARVRELGRAFVRSVTATEHALKRFGE